MTAPTPPDASRWFLRRGGEMGAQMRAHDWSDTPVGDPDSWPISLRHAVSVLLDCQLPMYLAWGPKLIAFYNDAYRPILGDKDVGALGRPSAELWSEIWPTIGPMWARVLEGEPVGFDDFRLTIERFGYPEDCWFNFSYSPVPGDDGRIAGLLVTFAETTRAVKGERRLRFLDELSQATRRLANPARIMRETAERLGRHLGVNRCAYATVHDDGDTFDLIGDYCDRVDSIVGRYRFSDFGAVVHGLMLQGLPYVNGDVDVDSQTAGTDLSAYRLTQIRAVICIPLLKEGRFVAAMAVHQATPRQWTREEVELVATVVDRCWEAMELTRVQADLQEANRRKDEFLAMLGHELRNPLAPIATASLLLEQRPDDARVVARARDVIRRQVDHMRRLLDDLLDVSRVTRGLIRLQMRPVDMRNIVHSALEQARPLLEARRHRVTVTLPDAPVWVNGDATRLVQVLANLLNNAGKFTADGGEVRVGVTDGAGSVLVRVADDGIGMDAELLKNVFALFTQGDRAAPGSQGGLGIGLALVKALVGLHGGEVVAESAGPGAGSRFSVRLPRCAPPSLPEGAEREAAAPEPAHPASRPLRVLVTDDNIDAADLLASYLATSGWEVTVCHRGGEALERAASTVFDVCILDIGLPDMTGFDLVRQLRLRPHLRKTRFIALTGYGQPTDRADSLQAGFDEHLVKPVRHDALLSALNPPTR